MLRPTLSAILITRNEADRLARALESVRWVDEIVVVDSGSTDQTEEIARTYTQRFVTRSDWAGFGVQKQRALELATSEWVLSLDADEEVTSELRQSIEAAMARPGNTVGFEVERHTYQFGRWFGRRAWGKDRVLRVFRRDRARFTPAVIHERVVVEGAVARLRGPLLHYSYRDLEHHFAKMNEFTSAMARQRFERGERGGITGAVARGAGRFWKNYLLRGMILYGAAGFMAAAMSGIYTFLAYAKLWEPSSRAKRRDSAAQSRDLAGASASRPPHQ